MNIDPASFAKHANSPEVEAVKSKVKAAIAAVKARGEKPTIDNICAEFTDNPKVVENIKKVMATVATAHDKSVTDLPSRIKAHTEAAIKALNA